MILLDKGGNREWKLREILPEYKPDADRRQRIENAQTRLETAWGRGDDTNSACHAFNMFVMHPSKFRGDYGVYDSHFEKLTLTIQDFKIVLEEVGLKFELIE